MVASPLTRAAASAVALSVPAHSVPSTPALVAPAAAGGACSAPLFECDLVKHGHPWRGCYLRVLTVGGGAVATLDPSSRCATNTWRLDRGDLHRVEVRPAAEVLPSQPHAAGAAAAREAALCFFVAPWPKAPEWLAQRLVFTSAAGGGEVEQIVAALAKEGVVIARRSAPAVGLA